MKTIVIIALILTLGCVEHEYFMKQTKTQSQEASIRPHRVPKFKILFRIGNERLQEALSNNRYEIMDVDTVFSGSDTIFYVEVNEIY